ncbi:MAG TPA: hypothetical protein VH253_02220 [Phycisphaerae bacterium]|nr:hypothetical protein [Phycisphaerae bacterium]
MTDMTDFRAREREDERGAFMRKVLVALVPIALIAAALLGHLAMMKMFGA